MAETPEKTEVADETVSLDNKQICPCCGQLMKKVPLEITDDLFDFWLACVMTGTPFSHKYSLYKGKLTVTVKSFTEEGRQLLKTGDTCVAVLKEHFEGNQTLLTQLDEIRQVLHNCYCVDTIEVSAAATRKLFHPSSVMEEGICKLEEIRKRLSMGTEDDSSIMEDLKKVRAFITASANISSTPAHILFTIVDTHFRLSEELEQQGFDSNFWMGIRQV